MITATDIGNIIYRDCEAFGIERYQAGDFDEKLPVEADRAVVRVQRQQREKIWRKGFIDVNLCAPDVKGEANLVRLNQLERQAYEILGQENVSEYDGDKYTYSIYSTEMLADEQMKCHYVNVKLLFQVLA